MCAFFILNLFSSFVFVVKTKDENKLGIKTDAHCTNRQFTSCLLPLCHNESSYETVHIVFRLQVHFHVH